jgi:thioredoxin/glutathione reductase (selenoprotein)
MTEKNDPSIDAWENDGTAGEATRFDYDLIVIGGGSGGLAMSQEASRVSGKALKIAVLDFVNPSPQGTTWGLGGTCVNVGCIPKKLMHQAALLGEALHDARDYGWELAENVEHNWTKLVEAVSDHIGSLNWGYRSALREAGIEYLNARGTFIDAHTVEIVDKAMRVSRKTARRFVIAVGGRPKPLDISGCEYCISSDDLFSLEHAPGKSLVIGASYVALECAGFLKGLGFEVCVMARSIFLRGFDQQMAELVVKYMEEHGTKFIRPATPQRIEKLPSGRLRVFWRDSVSSEEISEEFDTVLMAVGRRPESDGLLLANAGVHYDRSTGKIPVINERTNVPHIYAIGDVIQGKLELTPVAIKAGKLLADRLYAGSTLFMDYGGVPTTTFTPLEYSSCGFSEEEAIEKIGQENIEVYHTYYTPLEWTIPHHEENACYAKVICNRKDNERVIGIHILGEHSGEIIQGFAVAMKCGLVKSQMSNTVGIHPTAAEELLVLRITKRSGEPAKRTGC